MFQCYILNFPLEWGCSPFSKLYPGSSSRAGEFPIIDAMKVSLISWLCVHNNILLTLSSGYRDLQDIIFDLGTYILLQLYASWCTHSQAALSEFLQTIQYVVDNNITRLVVGKIDVIKHGGKVMM